MKKKDFSWGNKNILLQYCIHCSILSVIRSGGTCSAAPKAPGFPWFCKFMEFGIYSEIRRAVQNFVDSCNYRKFPWETDSFNSFLATHNYINFLFVQQKRTGCSLTGLFKHVHNCSPMSISTSYTQAQQETYFTELSATDQVNLVRNYPVVAFTLSFSFLWFWCMLLV